MEKKWTLTDKPTQIIVSIILFFASISFASDKVPLRAQDRVEIQHIMREYIQALDSHNADALIAQFTPDGQLKAGKDAGKGREAIKKMVVDAWKNMEAANKGDKNENVQRLLYCTRNSNEEDL